MKSLHQSILLLKIVERNNISGILWNILECFYIGNDRKRLIVKNINWTAKILVILFDYPFAALLFISVQATP